MRQFQGISEDSLPDLFDWLAVISTPKDVRLHVFCHGKQSNMEFSSMRGHADIELHWYEPCGPKWFWLLSLVVALQSGFLSVKDFSRARSVLERLSEQAMVTFVLMRADKSPPYVQYMSKKRHRADPKMALQIDDEAMVITIDSDNGSPSGDVTLEIIAGANNTIARPEFRSSVTG